MRFSCLPLLFLLVVANGSAQGTSQRTRYDDGWRLKFHATPTFNPRSLLDFVRQSTLIIDGTVKTVLPPIDTSQDHIRPGIETHSIVSVTEILAGSIANKSANILLAQWGGELGKWAIEVEDDPLVTVGKRYILFLNPDERKELPNTSGIPRFAVIGVSSGKVDITNGMISFAKTASEEVRGYNGTNAEAFLQQLRQLIKHPYSDSQLPINLAPKRN